MAAIAVNQAPTNSTQALFQTWAGGISAAIEQAGLAKTQLRGFGVTPRISMATNGAAGSPAFTVPVNVQTGDFMLVTVAVPSGTTVTPPGTWTQQRTDVAAGGTGPVRQYVFYRVATSADTFVGTSGSRDSKRIRS